MTTEIATDIEGFLIQAKSRVESVLSDFLPSVDSEPQRLHEAMRYATLGGGKRIRAALVYATGQSFGANMGALDYAAAAVECIHAYSLIHDDLPCMDDDDLRRGQPTTHKAFDEATAVLAGDALQAFAFELIANARMPLGLKMVQLLAQSSGASGMVGGQMRDMLAENQNISVEDLEALHLGKTGALICASIMLGALAAEQGEPGLMRQLHQFGSDLGLAFQIHDDVLDVTSDTETLGKTAGADQNRNKSTFVTLLGIEGAQARAEEQLSLARQRLWPLKQDTRLLDSLSTYVIKRLY
ncbi:MAG: geranyl transferase [Legionellales bacterium]|nr:geranyl transferase [Legionellales bacterium]